MNLRLKASLFVVFTILAIVAMVQITNTRASLANFRSIEEAQIVSATSRVEKQVQTSIADISGTAADWGYWEDSYDYVLDGNVDFADENLYAEAFTPIGVDVVVFTQPSGDVRFGAEYRDGEELPVPDALIERMNTIEIELTETDEGVLIADDTVYLVAIRNVLGEESTVESGGRLLMARRADAAYVAALAELTDLDVDLSRCGPVDCAAVPGTPTIERSGNQIAAEGLISDVDGAPALRIDVVQDRTVYNEGVASAWRVFFATSAMGLLAMILSVTLIRRAVNRIEKLEVVARRVSETKDHSVRVDVDGHDEIGSLAVGMNDMLTGLQEAKSEVDRASEAKSRFLSRVSHEVRNPLNGVMAYAQLLQLDELEPDQMDAVEQILVGARHITELMEEFLDMARIEAGMIPLHITTTVVTDIVDETLDLMRPAAAERSIEMHHTGNVKDIVEADPTRLRQVVLNLVSNAVKYNDEGGIVNVTHEVVGDRTLISVRDNGRGIPPEHLDRLFTPFDRLEADQTSTAGTGVGLSVTRQLLELMGGSIRVRSQIGLGSEFIVELPATPGSVPLTLEDLPAEARSTLNS